MIVDPRSAGRPVLPTIPDGKLCNDSTHISPAVAVTYGVCLDVEKELMHRQIPILTAVEAKALESALFNIRILGHLLVSRPHGYHTRAHWEDYLGQQDRGSDPRQLGGFYDQLCLRPCRFSPSRG